MYCELVNPCTVSRDDGRHETTQGRPASVRIFLQSRAARRDELFTPRKLPPLIAGVSGDSSGVRLAARRWSVSSVPAR